MKRFAILFSCLLGIYINANAQTTYTQHLQQQQSGKGKVTVTQSKEIDNLVNGIAQDNVHANNPKPNTTTPSPSTSSTSPVVNQVVKGDSTPKEREKRSAETQEGETEPSVPTVDMRKKIMRGSHKVTGFRVQAFAGGGTRADRQKAQQIGNAIKMKYPDQPIYVHFYAPRWICRVGNYRTYAEAQSMLKAVMAMGYKSATIVKGKITVFE